MNKDANDSNSRDLWFEKWFSILNAFATHGHGVQCTSINRELFLLAWIHYTKSQFNTSCPTPCPRCWPLVIIMKLIPCKWIAKYDFILILQKWWATHDSSSGLLLVTFLLTIRVEILHFKSEHKQQVNYTTQVPLKHW